MMIRTLLFLLVSASLILRASEPISVPYGGASTTIKQPHVTAELIPESLIVEAGKPLGIILHLHSDPGWHTYWINPGDAGLATTIKWTLPDGFAAGPIQWPTPEKHKMGPLVTYGYEGDVYLITTITPSVTFPQGPQTFNIKAKANWLVCQEECIPGKGEFSVKLYTQQLPPVENTKLFNEARMRLPVPNTRWDVKAAYGECADMNISPAPLAVNFEFKEKEKKGPDTLQAVFFPEQTNVLSVLGQRPLLPMWPTDAGFTFSNLLQQNGEKTDKMSGVLVSDVPLIGNAKAVYISEFPVTSEVAAAVPSGGSASSATNTDDGHRPPLQGKTAPSEAQPFLLAVLGAAFIGGLILNLMPCVLPVLSLKVFSLIKHAEHAHSQAWKQGVAFTVGVVLSFWLLAGLLLTLRAAGNHLGWGFQMQSPGFVLALIFIFFILALNLFGVFELGTSLVGLDSKVTGRHNHGLLTSFLNGALATLAATPCTAPFMGSALGFAAQQPAFVSLLIFTFLALGMAAPYLLLTIFPGALKFVPKPGAWMETFKQFMGFLLMATVIFLLYVFGALVGQDGVFELLFGLLLGAVAAWAYGGRQRSSPATGWLALIVGVFLISGLAVGVHAAMNPVQSNPSERKADNGYLPWSQDAVQKALADGKPVFVDFTAAWCLSCKVNERVALDTDAVRKAFSDKGVVLFKADWTHSDPEISKALQQYNRDGVPLYLLYSPKDPTKPQVLPEVLTPGIVLDALNKL